MAEARLLWDSGAASSGAAPIWGLRNDADFQHSHAALSSSSPSSLPPCSGSRSPKSTEDEPFSSPLCSETLARSHCLARARTSARRSASGWPWASSMVSIAVHSRRTESNLNSITRCRWSRQECSPEHHGPDEREPGVHLHGTQLGCVSSWPSTVPQTNGIRTGLGGIVGSVIGGLTENPVRTRTDKRYGRA